MVQIYDKNLNNRSGAHNNLHQREYLNDPLDVARAFISFIVASFTSRNTLSHSSVLFVSDLLSTIIFHPMRSLTGMVTWKPYIDRALEFHLWKITDLDILIFLFLCTSYLVCP